MPWMDKITFRRAKAIEIKDPPDPGPVKNNPLDKLIVEKGNTPTASEIYKARWVWYHTILAVEIAFTNILLLALLVVEIIK
jgi:hypothetical protein